MMLKRVSIVSFWGACLILLLTSKLLWGCAALKQKFSKKESQVMSLSREELLKDQSAAMEHTERELIKYFGESAVLMLKDGFRFHQDSGLMGNSALMHYQSQGVLIDKQKDSSSLAYRSEISSRKDVEFKTVEIEKQKSRSLHYWWLLLLFLLLWVIRKRLFRLFVGMVS